MSQSSAQFHIKSNDYFATLATSLSLVKQLNKESINNQGLIILDNLEKDLLFLQEKYLIVRRQ